MADPQPRGDPREPGRAASSGEHGRAGSSGEPGRAGSSGETEEALVLACAGGDRDAWVRFVDRYGPLLQALARRMLLRRTGRAPDADVEEVTSGVFLALLQGDRRLLRRYRPEFRLSTYLGVICRTQVGKLARRPLSLARPEEVEEPAADAGAETPLAALERKEKDAALVVLKAALDALPPRDRLLLTMRFLEDLDYGQIAEVLRLRRESVGQLLHRAKERLAKRVPQLAAWVGRDEPPAGPPGSGGGAA